MCLPTPAPPGLVSWYASDAPAIQRWGAPARSDNPVRHTSDAASDDQKVDVGRQRSVTTVVPEGGRAAILEVRDMLEFDR